MKNNYITFFNTINVGWTRYSKDGNKIGVYKEVNYVSVLYLSMNMLLYDSKYYYILGMWIQWNEIIK